MRMGKSTITGGVVISLKPQGENNSLVCCFAENLGIIYASMYGGAKSRLRSLVSPWNSGTLYLSESSRAKMLKISDFDVKKYHLSFRENLLKGFAASLAAELIIKTKCAGNHENAWLFFNGFLDGLELCADEEQISSGLIRFLWRFLDLLGVRPDALKCSHCGKDFLTNISYNNESYLSCGALYNASENVFLCSECTSKESGFFLNHEAIRYLAAVSLLLPQESRLIPLSEETRGKLKQFLFFLIENASGSHLKTLETGMGIL